MIDHLMTAIKSNSRSLVERLMNKKVSILIILGLIAHLSYAQKGIELGGWLGTGHYFGDLHTSFSFDEPRPAGGLIFRYNFDERISLKSSVNYTRIHGDDARSDNSYEFNRQLSFYSDIFDWTNQLEFNFFPYFHGSEEENWTPYLYVGFSALSYNPKRNLEDGSSATLRLFGTEGQPLGEEYGRFTMASAFGMGIKWDINYDWSINAEIGMRVARSDYLDDVSGVYPDFDELRRVRGESAVRLSDPSTTATAFRQRGNNKNNDSYVLFGFSILRYFGRLPCPKISQSR